ncbi:hypothetical protein BVIET440_200080 [Burkholderia vietnamiensis]
MGHMCTKNSIHILCARRDSEYYLDNVTGYYLNFFGVPVDAASSPRTPASQGIASI